MEPKPRFQAAACDRMHRRSFLSTVAAGAVLSPRSGFGGQPSTPVQQRDLQQPPLGESPQRFLLSRQGSGRATGYYFSTKIVTVGQKTHVCWLDSVKDGFRVQVRTRDRGTGEWSPTYTIGKAFDNHGGPALTVDSQGFLHILYYPHHHPFRYRKSRRPNDASAWGDEVQFGHKLTYPTLVCGADDTLYLSCRQYWGKETPGQLQLWTKRAHGDWTGPAPLAVARHTGYAAFSESLYLDPQRQVLHLACRFHEKSDSDAYGRIQSVAYMRSPDLGKTWTRSDGTVLETPVTANRVETLVLGGLDRNRVLDVGAMAVDEDGHPHVVYSVRESAAAETFLAVHRGSGDWTRTPLSKFLPDHHTASALAAGSGVVVNRGEIIVTAHLQRANDALHAWGHPSNEVVQLVSGDGARTFHFRAVSPPDATRAHWLSNVERISGHNTIPERAGVLYTAGPPGAGLKDILENEVWWVG